jgi:hypothetical protein
MALVSTQSVTEMSTRNLPGGKARPAPKFGLTNTFEPTFYKMWEPRRLSILWAPLPFIGRTADFGRWISVEQWSDASRRA